MPPLLLLCYNVAAAVKTPANTGRERLGRNLGRHHKLGDCEGPRLAASHCRSSTRVRSSATWAWRASISCEMSWPNNVPCCTRAARSGSDPAESIVGQTVLSGRRCRIQMRVQRRFYWTANEQDRWRVLPRAVRVEQNPLPHRWFDRHGGPSRNSGRSNEASERLSSPQRVRR